MSEAIQAETGTIPLDQAPPVKWKAWLSRCLEALLVAMVIVILIFSYAAFCAGSLELAWPYVQGYRLIITPNVLDLGVQPVDSLVKSSIRVSNLSSHTVTLTGAQPSCGCITPADFPIKIASGQSHDVLVQLATPKTAGRINHFLRIFSDSSVHSIIQVEISGTVE